MIGKPATLTETTRSTGVDFGVTGTTYTTTCECGWSTSWLSTGHTYFHKPRTDYDAAIANHRLEHLEGKYPFKDWRDDIPADGR